MRKNEQGIGALELLYIPGGVVRNTRRMIEAGKFDEEFRRSGNPNREKLKLYVGAVAFDTIKALNVFLAGLNGVYLTNNLIQYLRG